MRKIFVVCVLTVLVLLVGCEDISLEEGTSIEYRLQNIHDKIHYKRSGELVRNSFTDLVEVHEWEGTRTAQARIFPFTHYYSSEADTTFVICNLDRVVAICDGKVAETLETAKGLDHCHIYEGYSAFIP